MANTAHTTLEITPRHAWLALLGSAGLVRRQFVASACAARSRAMRFGETVRTGGTDARHIARGAWLTVQEKLAKKPQRHVSRRAR